MTNLDIVEFLKNSVLLSDPVAVASLAVATFAFVLNWLTRRSQKSARIAIEVFPRKSGVYLSISNVGDRIAYNCELSIKPKELNPALNRITVIAPQRSFQAYLCDYDDIPSHSIEIVIRYHDPIHERLWAEDRASFDTSHLEEYQVVLDKDFDCFEVMR